MMRVAWRTALSDLRASWQQALLIGVILLAACATLMLALTLLRSAEAPWDRAFDKANGAHLTFYAWGEPGDQTALPDLSTLGTAPGVAAAGEVIPGLDDVPLVANGTRQTLALQAPDSLPQINQPLLTDGSWLSGAPGEIVLHRSVARAANIDVGDTITLSNGGAPLTLRVVGTAVSPWRELYPASAGLSWLTLDDLRALEPDISTWYVTIGVRLTDPTGSMGVEQAAHALLTGGAPGGTPGAIAGIGSENWQDTRADVTEWNRINAGFLGMFSLVALLASALVTTNVVAARVLAQARQIGLLKAVGVTPLGVVATFLVQHLIIALVAALGGVVVGLAFAPLLLRRLANALQTTSAPVLNAEILLIAGVIVASAMLVVTLATVVPALRAGRQTVVRTLTAGVTSVSAVAGRGRGSRLARLAARLHLPLVVQLGLKDTFARPGRAALTIGALTISLVTIIFSLGAQATFDRITDEPALQGEPFDLEVRRRDMPTTDALAVLESNPDIASVYPRAGLLAQMTRQQRTDLGETAAQVPPQTPQFSTMGPETATYLVRAIEGDLQEAGFLIASNRGRMPQQTGEAVAGRGLFEELDLQVGDTLDVTFQGRTIPVTLVGQYLEDDDDGEVLMLSMETARQLLPDVEPSTYLVHLRSGASGEAVALSLLQTSSYQLDIWTRDDEADNDADAASIQGVVTGLGLTLAFVGLINLIATTVISVRERTREYAIFRTLGLTPAQITLVVGSSIALLAALAGVIGVPLGLLVSRLVYFGVLQNNLGLLPEWFTSPAWWQLLVMIPALVLAALAAGALPARQATRIDIAQALRAD